MLDTIWTGQSGQEIIYPWVDWLQNSSLSYLNVDDRIPLASSEKAGNARDRRAFSESVSPDVDIPYILNYNAGKCNEKFCQNLHECSICLSEYPGTKFVRLPCSHFFCRNCMDTYSTMYAKESLEIPCPQMKCREPVPPGLVRSLLGDENFDKWELQMFYKTLDSMSDLVYCPRCDMACLEAEDHLAQCPQCFFTFCGLCGDRFHVEVQCMTSEEKLKFLQQQRKELDMINKLLNVEEIKRTTKQCPKCSMAITRTSGCNHMHCTRCQQDFCYKCGKAYVKGKKLCCAYFDFNHETDSEALERRHEVLLQQQGQKPNKMQADDPTSSRVHSCPLCSQMNAKVEDNNHIFCWACQKQYCYLCRNIVEQSSQHYGPKGCKQYSAG
ncbi:hypothetical protein MKW94_014090 [Papaver nudicaule]|uniref:RBR-type E3 ubiquitin transferase n=1 Tax=Papaver nudicaule TaxID=74823 RepID=A0AA41V0Z7_PAPNU|nr:hypothetical protein [Papaver nudicaule]